MLLRPRPRTRRARTAAGHAAAALGCLVVTLLVAPAGATTPPSTPAAETTTTSSTPAAETTTTSSTTSSASPGEATTSTGGATTSTGGATTTSAATGTTEPGCPPGRTGPGCDQTSSPEADPCKRRNDDQTGSPRGPECSVDPLDGISACLDVPVGLDCAPFVARYGRDCAAGPVEGWCDEYGGLLLEACAGHLGPDACEPGRPGLRRRCHGLADASSAEAGWCHALGLAVGPPEPAEPTTPGGDVVPAPGPSTPATGPPGPTAGDASSPTVSSPRAGGPTATTGTGSPVAPGPAPTQLGGAGAFAGPPDATPPTPTPTPTATLPPSTAPTAAVEASTAAAVRPALVEVLAAGVGEAASPRRVGALVARGPGGPLLAWPEVLATVVALAALVAARARLLRRRLARLHGPPA
jgi:hypothetical protein